MEIGISTRCFGSAPLNVDLLESLRRAGFSRIELQANRPAFDFHNRSLVRGIGRWFEENGLPPPSIHLPFEEELDPGRPRALSIADPLARVRSEALDEFKRCLELADRIATSYTVLHIGVPGQEFNPVVFDHAYAAISTIQSFCGSRVLIENIPNAISTPGRIHELRTIAQLPNIGFCYDTGHGGGISEFGSRNSDSGNVTAEWSPNFQIAPDAIHIDDNNGTADDHLWPFEGTFNWHLFVERLVIAEFKGPLILEAQDDRLQKAYECRGRLLDLVDECRHSIEEFRLKYKLPFPNQEDSR
jgi:sugar phosphate isomerase/epimerase